MDKGKKRNLSEVAADYVREQILQGKLAQREKLVENDIAVTPVSYTHLTLPTKRIV